jgi:hypothetical protein
MSDLREDNTSRPLMAGTGPLARAWLPRRADHYCGDASASSASDNVLTTLRKAHQLATSSPSISEERILFGALNTNEPCCFLTIVGDNPCVSVVHHLSNYTTSFRAAGPLEGRVVAFIGDSSTTSTRAGDHQYTTEESIPLLFKAPANDTSKALFGNAMPQGIDNLNLLDINIFHNFYTEQDESILIPFSHVANNLTTMKVKQEDGPHDNARPQIPNLLKLMWIPTK